MPCGPSATTVPGVAVTVEATGAAAQMRSVSPSRWVKATGQGLKARTWRSSAAADRNQSSSASALLSFSA